MMLSKLTSSFGEKFEKFVKFVRGDRKSCDKPSTDSDQEWVLTVDLTGSNRFKTLLLVLLLRLLNPTYHSHSQISPLSKVGSVGG